MAELHTVLQERVEPVRYLLFRCMDCGRLITRDEVYTAWNRGTVNVCTCGGGRAMKPANAKWWEELLPRVMWFWARRIAWPWVKGRIWR